MDTLADFFAKFIDDTQVANSEVLPEVSSMTERLVKQKRIRAGHKASTTKMLSEVDVLLAVRTPDSGTYKIIRTQAQN